MEKKRYKIVVYAISKNEEKFVDRWMDSMSEADEVIVLDTGSTDNTVDMLKARGATVHVQTVTPWRFDVARNISLSLVPDDADICVCTDIDEFFHKGWRKILENAWTDDVSQAQYRYTWNFTSDGKEGVVFWAEKIHARHGFKWTHPVHEILEWISPSPMGRKIAVQGIQLDHKADETKSRAQYLPLLEMSVEEDPDDDRNMHYLGREYMFKGRWEDCIKTLKKHLAMPKATWKDERASSMRFIAKSYLMLKNAEEAKIWYMKSICEAPHLREPYCDMATALYTVEEWEGVIYFIKCALKIKERPKTYINEESAWGSLPYDLLSIAYYKTGNLRLSLENATKALEFYPNDERLKKNVKIIQSALDKKSENK